MRAFGAEESVLAAYIAYRQANGPYRHFAINSKWGYARAQDIDYDGIDELLILEGQQWGIDCSASMSTLPHRLRIKHLDTASGSLVDVTRSYGAYLRTFLVDLKSRYDFSANENGTSLTDDCQAQWAQLLKETYESAWFILLLTASGIAILTFAMGLSKSPSWRWFAKSIGAITFFATTGVAIYSLGKVGWHVMAFSDFWRCGPYLWFPPLAEWYRIRHISPS